MPKLAKHMQLAPSPAAAPDSEKFIIAIIVAVVVSVGASILIGVKCWRGSSKHNRKSVLEEPLNS